MVDAGKSEISKAVNDDRVKLMFAHKIPGESFAPNVNLVLVGTAGNKTLDQVAEENARTIRSLKVEAKMQTLTLPFGLPRIHLFL